MESMDRIELDERSWIEVGRGFLPKDEADALYEELTQSDRWQQTQVFRYDHWRDEPRLTTMFRVADAPEPLKQVQRDLQNRYGLLFDGFALNWYRNERDGQAFHRDRDLKWLDNTLIAILTLGAQRPWLIRPWTSKYDHSEGKGAVMDLAPASGDLIVMGGATQVSWQHSVAQLRRPVGGRMSVQWRWTSRTGKQEIGGSYSKPLTYGAKPRGR
jgi:alkylated DNA repair dioxygenase AlkB